MKSFLKNIVSPYAVSQYFKLLALVASVHIVWLVKSWVVAVVAIFIIGTLIASEAFVLFLARSLRKEPTDENIVKLFIVIIFRDREQVNKILNQYDRRGDS